MKKTSATPIALGIVGALSLGAIGTTSAAFLQTLQGAGELAGSVTVAQGPDSTAIYDDPNQPNLVAQIVPGDDSAVVTTLYQDQAPYPTRSTGGFTLTAGLLQGSADANVRSIVSLPEASAPWMSEHLLLGVYVNGEMRNPEGVPLTMQQITDLGGVDLGVISAEDAPISIEYRVWLGSQSPAEAYNTQVTLNATLLGTTATGAAFDLNVELL